MKNVENELKELILDNYGSLAEFCKKIDNATWRMVYPIGYAVNLSSCFGR